MDVDEKTIEELHSYYDRLPGVFVWSRQMIPRKFLLANAESELLPVRELAGVQRS